MCCYEARVVGLFIQLCNPGRTVHPAPPNGSTEFPKMTTPEIGAVQPEHYAAWSKCSERIPEDGLKYYLLLGCREGVVSYYSKWIAWNDGGEVRVPRLVKAKDAALSYRSRNIVCLILHNLDELNIWYAHWGTYALVEKALWDAFDCE